MKDLKDYEGAMEKCSSCAFCEAVCPVFKAELLETHVARARVGLIKGALLDGALPLSKRGKDVIDRCLLCTRCVASCPAGVPVDEIVIAARHRIHGGKRQNLPTRMVMNNVLEKRGFTGWRKKAFEAAGKRGLAPGELPAPVEEKFDDIFHGLLKPGGKARARVAYYTGCATNGFFTDTGKDVVKVLLANDFEVMIPEEISCCGIPSLAEGDLERAESLMRANIAVLSGMKVDAIVSDCTSCVLSFTQKIEKLIPADDPIAKQVREVAGKFREVTEFMAESGLNRSPGELKKRFCRHDPCHGVRMGEMVSGAPLKLLKQVQGLKPVSMETENTCCGAGGTFFNEYPDLAREIRKEPLAAYAESGADVLVTQCPSCRIYLSAALKGTMEVMHPVSLLASAYDDEGE